MSTQTAAMPPPQNPSHRRTKTSILKSIVSPHKSTHKKSSSTCNIDPSNPLNDYMWNSGLPPQLPPLKLDLQPPQAPFVLEERKSIRHKRSLSAISLSSLSGGGKREASPAPSPSRGSFDISDKLRDLVSGNRGAAKETKMKKSKSAIDISILRRKPEKNKQPKSPTKDKENRTPIELSPMSSISSGKLDLSMFGNGELTPVVSEANNRSSESIGRITRSRDASPHRSYRASAELPRRSRRERREDVKKYTPTEYTPAAQRSFPQEPTLAKPDDRGRSPVKSSKSKPRPKSAFIPSTKSLTAQYHDVTPRKSYEYRRTEDKPLPEAPKLGKSSPTGSEKSGKSAGLDSEEIDTAFEELLKSRDVPEYMKDRMRALDVRVKQEFIHKERQLTRTATEESAKSSGMSARSFFGRRPKSSCIESAAEARPKSRGREDKDNDRGRSASPSKRSRPRSRTFGAHKEKESFLASLGAVPGSPIKKQKHDKTILPPPATAPIPAGPPSPTRIGFSKPEEWMVWLKEAGRRKNFGQRMFVDEASKQPELEQGMRDVEIAVLHKLRLVLRNEAVRWVESFLKLGGFEAIWTMLERVLGVEWREDHEDSIFHELLLCIKGLCTASLALQKLSEMGPIIFPRLLESLFDEEHKGPAEFNTRALIIALLNVHLSTSPASQRPLRTRRILSYLSDKKPETTRRPLEFIEIAHTPRPYRRWCKEVINVTKEVFWIFLHGSNIVPLLPAASSSLSYAERNFPSERPPIPAAAHVGGVEWEASNYLAAHLDLLNGCIASLATREERSDLRLDLRNSGWERVMGGALRTCKEKLHMAVHETLKTWVRAAGEDGWCIDDVRFGPRVETRPSSPVKRKKKEEAPPRLDLDLGERKEGGSGWDY